MYPAKDTHTTAEVQLSAADRLAAMKHLGVNWVALTYNGCLDFDAASWVIVGSPSKCAGMPMADTEWIIDEAHRQGLQVALETTCTAWINGQNHHDLQNAFASLTDPQMLQVQTAYSTFQLGVAEVAQKHNVDAMFIEKSEGNLAIRSSISRSIMLVTPLPDANMAIAYGVIARGRTPIAYPPFPPRSPTPPSPATHSRESRETPLALGESGDVDDVRTSLSGRAHRQSLSRSGGPAANRRVRRPVPACRFNPARPQPPPPLRRRQRREKVRILLWGVVIHENVPTHPGTV